MYISITSRSKDIIQNAFIYAAFISILLFLSSITATAQVSVSGSASFVTKYIWRGYNIVDKPTIQPSVDLGFGSSGLSANIWTSFSLSDRDKYGSFDEIDLTLDYSMGEDNGRGFSVGLIYYILPNQDNFDFGDHTTPEVYASFTPKIPGFSSTLAIYKDLNLSKGIYITVGAEKSIDVGFGSVGTRSLIAYNNGHTVTKDGISHREISVFASISAGSVEIGPSLTYYSLAEDTVNKDNEFVLNVTVGWDF